MSCVLILCVIGGIYSLKSTSNIIFVFVRAKVKVKQTDVFITFIGEAASLALYSEHQKKLYTMYTSQIEQLEEIPDSVRRFRIHVQ